MDRKQVCVVIALSENRDDAVNFNVVIGSSILGHASRASAGRSKLDARCSQEPSYFQRVPNRSGWRSTKTVGKPEIYAEYATFRLFEYQRVGTIRPGKSLAVPADPFEQAIYRMAGFYALAPARYRSSHELGKRAMRAIHIRVRFKDAAAGLAVIWCKLPSRAAPFGAMLDASFKWRARNWRGPRRDHSNAALLSAFLCRDGKDCSGQAVYGRRECPAYRLRQTGRCQTSKRPMTQNNE